METLRRHSTANNSALKIIFTVLFIILPFVGFYWGIQYQASIAEPTAESLEIPTTLVRTPTPTPTPTPKQESTEFIQYLCNSGGEKYHGQTPIKFSPKVYKCGEYYSVYAERFIMDAPVIIVTLQGKAVASCGGFRTEHEPNPICDYMSCDQTNLCKGIEINCEGLTNDYYESCLCENYIRTGRKPYLEKITKTDLKNRCPAIKESEDKL